MNMNYSSEWKQMHEIQKGEWKEHVLFSFSVESNCLQPHGLHHARFSCLSLSPRVCSDSCPLSWWCHPTISSSLASLLLLPSTFPSIRVFSKESALRIRWPKFGSSAAALVLPVNIQGWFPLGLTHLISLLSKGVSKVFSSTTIKKHQFFNAQPALWSNSNHWTAREVPMFAFIGLKHSNFHEGLFFPQCLGSAGLVKSRWPPLAQSWD